MKTAADVTDVIRLLEREQYREILARALVITDENKDTENWLGFLWRDINASPLTLNRLCTLDVLYVEFQSRKYTHYKLINPEIVREALEFNQISTGEQVPEPEIPSDIFDSIVGQDHVKRAFKMALSAPKPVHVLLLGPPATSKTLFLGELASLPYARYALGGTTSRAGIIDYLLKEPCYYLIMDELDKMDGRDISALLSLMETGLIARLKKGKSELQKTAIWVFAGANREDRIPPELRSRFLKIRLAPYSETEFIEVVESVLVKREHTDPGMARYIAISLIHKSQDPRDAVRIARMCKTREDVQAILRELF